MRGSIRSDRAPATGAMNIGARVHGRMRRPAPTGPYPWIDWKNCASRKIEPNIPKNIRNDDVFASANVRLEKNRIGSIGAFARSSQATNAATRVAPMTSEPTISGLVQPWPLPRTSPQTIPNRPALASASPGRSSLPPGPWLSSSRRSASGTSTIPIGTLSQKIHCHAIPSTTAPPTSGPKAIASPPTPPHAPSARPRFSGGTAALSSVRVSGITIAPPRPCTARATLSASMLGATAAATEPRVKIARPSGKHPAPPESVSERGAGEKQHRERQRIGVDRPLELLEGRAEIHADHGDRRRDDEVVERDHEQRERGDRERPEGRGASCHWYASL